MVIQISRRSLTCIVICTSKLQSVRRAGTKMCYSYQYLCAISNSNIKAMRCYAELPYLSIFNWIKLHTLVTNPSLLHTCHLNLAWNHLSTGSQTIMRAFQSTFYKLLASLMAFLETVSIVMYKVVMIVTFPFLFLISTATRHISSESD